VWARSSYAGNQRYPVHWAGDPLSKYYSMACSLKAGLGLSLSGFAFWNADIGGYKGIPTPDLYVRWAQFSLFCSHVRCHGISSREPWVFGKEALEIFRFYDKLRYRLIPYLYSYAHEASETGLPLMRPLVLEYQEDPNTYTRDLQYLLGKELLVAPVFNPQGQVNIYLPQGTWIDYWTGKEYQGPVNIKDRVDLKTLPLFVRQDSIIPMGPEMSYVEEKPFDPITLDMYISDEARFTLRDDEETIEFVCRKRGESIQLHIGESDKRYIVKLNNATCPHTVMCEGTKVGSCTSQEFTQAEQGWYFEEGTLWIKTSIRGRQKIEVT